MYIIIKLTNSHLMTNFLSCDAINIHTHTHTNRAVVERQNINFTNETECAMFRQAFPDR